MHALFHDGVQLCFELFLTDTKDFAEVVTVSGCLAGQLLPKVLLKLCPGITLLFNVKTKRLPLALSALKIDAASGDSYEHREVDAQKCLKKHTQTDKTRCSLPDKEDVRSMAANAVVFLQLSCSIKLLDLNYQK